MKLNFLQLILLVSCVTAKQENERCKRSEIEGSLNYQQPQNCYFIPKCCDDGTELDGKNLCEIVNDKQQCLHCRYCKKRKTFSCELREKKPGGNYLELQLENGIHHISLSSAKRRIFRITKKASAIKRSQSPGEDTKEQIVPTTKAPRNERKEVEVTPAAVSKEDREKTFEKIKEDLSKLEEVAADTVANIAGTLDSVVGSLIGEPSSSESQDEASSVLNLLKTLSEKVILNETGEFEAVTKTFQIKVFEKPAKELIEKGLDFVPNVAQPTVGIDLSSSVFEQALQQLLDNQSSRRKREATGPKLRVYFQYYNQDTLFPSNQTLSSHVVAATVAGNYSIKKLPQPIKISYKNQSIKEEVKSLDTFKDKKTYKECVFWDGESRKWKNNGCCLETKVEPPECHCDHLTNFALLVKNDVVASTPVLSVFSDVGCYISIFCLLITILVYITNRKAMKMRATKIFLNIVINLTLALILFVGGVSQTANKSGCLVITAFLHYFLLTTWFWKTAYAYEVYLSLVKVFNTSREKYLQKLSVLCYSIPFIMVLLTASITIGGFDSVKAHRHCSDYLLEDSSYMSSNMCWIHGNSLRYGFLLPIALLLLTNIIMFFSVVYELQKKKGTYSADTKMVSDNLLLSITMALTMGMTWIFAYLVLISDDTTYFTISSWLFAITCGFQGFFIFLFSVARRSHLWMHLFDSTGMFGFLKLKKHESLQKRRSTYTTTNTEIGNIKVATKSSSVSNR